MKPAPKISEAEWKVMKLLWQRSPQSAQDLAAALADPTEWSLATVKTLLNRLLRKGALTYHQQGKTYFYSPAVTEADCQRREARSFLARVFDGALTPMLAQLVDTNSISPEELREIEKLIRRKPRP